jgi:integrase
VPLLDEVAQVLARRLNDLDLHGDDLVFAYPLTRDYVTTSQWTKLYERYQAALDRVDVPDGRKVRRFHDLRHTFGSQMAAGGVEIIKVSEWMGHENIQTTMIYVQFVPKTADHDLMQAAYASARNNGSLTAAIVAERLVAGRNGEADALQTSKI